MLRVKKNALYLNNLAHNNLKIHLYFFLFVAHTFFKTAEQYL